MKFLKNLISKIHKPTISNDEIFDLMIDFENLGYIWCRDLSSDWKSPILMIYSDVNPINVEDVTPYIIDIRDRLSKRGIKSKFYGGITKAICKNNTSKDRLLNLFSRYDRRYPNAICIVMNCEITS